MADDPFPTEEGRGGVAFQREVVAWEKRHQAASKQPDDSGSNNYTQVGSGSTTGTFDLTGFPAYAVAEAQQEAYDFGQLLGWPSWYDMAAMEKDVLQANLQSDSNQAMQFLWTQLNKDQQKDNPNAYFGLTKQQYTEKLNNLKDMYELYTGQTDVPDSLRNKALRENWTQSELLSNLEKDPRMGETAPWLSAGQSFRDIQSQFTQIYGVSAPKGALSSWWKFRTGALSVAPGAGAQEVAMPPPPLVSRQLQADVQTR